MIYNKRRFIYRCKTLYINFKYISFYLILIISFLSSGLYSQQSYDQTNFRSPLDIPLVLAGTFGELRNDHFHGGLDLKTQGQEGLNVYTVEDGYVSRIKLSHWGYGKAIYITHPNGYTSVYGHLSRLNPTIERYIKEIQYQRESYQVEAFPAPHELPLKKGDIIGYSGNTGGSSGPHLHFEIRNTNNQKPLNPLLFDFEVKDHKRPVVRFIYAYPLSELAQIDGSQQPIKINLKYLKNGYYQADTVFVSGVFGFAINTYDNQDDAPNKNGVFSIELKADEQRMYYHDVSKFSFSNTKYINKHIDYQFYKEHLSRLQKCFIEDSNQLDIYDKSLPDKGMLIAREGEQKTITIIVSDLDKNQAVINIPVMGKNITPYILKDNLVTNYQVKPREAISFSFDGIIVDFASNTFYDEHYLDLSQEDSITVKVHRDIYPLKKRFNVSFDISKYPIEERKHLVVALKGKKSKLYPVYSKLKGDQLIGRPKRLGTYTIMQDFKAPEIIPINFKPNQWLSTKNQLILKIKDNLSDIKSYRGTINGEFVLFEWDYKKGLITYDFSDKVFAETKHDLVVVVEDKAGNTKTYTTTFYRVYQ